MAPALGTVVLVSRMYPNAAQQSKVKQAQEISFPEANLSALKTTRGVQHLPR